MLRSLLVGLLIAFTSPAFSSEKVSLALNWKPEPQFGGFYSALTGGFDKKNGIDLAVEPGGAGTPVVQMVAAGKFEFGIASADEVVIARSRGAHVVALFAAYQTNPQGLMVHEERGFKTVGEIYKSDGTLAIQKGLPYAMYLAKKYPSAKAKIVPYLGGIQNFLSDKNFSQQCFVTSEPLNARKQGAKVASFLVADEGYNPYTTVLITTDEVLKAKPALVKAMVAAVRAGWREYLDKPEAANKKMNALNPSMDMPTFVESAAAQKALIETVETKKSGLGTMTETRWKDLGSQLLELKLIDKAPDAKTAFVNL